MSEESLRRLIDRLNTDEEFRQRLTEDPFGPAAEFELSPTETLALAANDEDALRRLAGAEVSGFLSSMNEVLRARTSPSTCGKTDNPTICELYATNLTTCPGGCK